MGRSSPNACLMFSLLILLIIHTFHSSSALSVAATRTGVSIVRAYCPPQCECEEVVEKGERHKISVYCHHGGLYQDDFFDIIKQISPKVTTLDIEAPPEKPNRLLWDDNLNRFKHLKVLRLVNCGIPAISRSLKLHSLEVLDLRGNNIDHITISIFSEVPSIKTLNLAHNLLSVLPTGAFTYLRNMETLSLAYNNISELSANLLRGHERLEALHLDGNHISVTQLNDLFSDVKQLQRLELNYCKIRPVEKLRLDKVASLNRLGLAGNQLGLVPTMILGNLSQLSTLDLADNGILEIASHAFVASNITHLFLARNHLGKTRDAFRANCFAGARIVEIDLSYNELENFDSTIFGDSQSSIETLHLNGNRITHFSAKFTHNLTSLHRLHMADNEITQIPAALPAEYAQLTFLNLSGNALDDFPDHSRQLLPSLVQLDISNNLFSSFSMSVLQNFINALDKVYLYNNPWDCGCLIDELKRHMNERYGYRWELRYEQTQCATPEDLRGAVIVRLNHISDCAVLFGARSGLSQASELSILLAALIIIALISSTVILLAYYRRERRQKKISYMDVRQSHSRTALTLSQHMSGSPSLVTEPLTPTLDSPLSGLSSKVPPPPPPPVLATF
uniref:LRRCT domain-containing protein n=1 Tax=Ascaris lumbricoides TaxID=6252 RepID=A0A0M3HXU9_ASCLU